MTLTHRIRASLIALSFMGAMPSVVTAQSAPPLLPLERQFRDGAPVLQRVAVVIGNSRYQFVPPLRNTVNDARAMAALLRENGFRVLEGYDLDKLGVEALLRDAVMAGGRRSDMVVFFAGHGVQIADKNYLLPVNAHLTDPDDLPFQSFSLDRMLSMLSTQSGSQIAVLDSCRNNPFEGRSTATGLRGIGAPILRGFAQPVPPSETLLAFSTAPGALALDGQGTNSPYTSALVGAARISPETPLDTVLTAVEQVVVQSTAGQQKPTFASALSRPFSLRAPAFVPMTVSDEPLFSSGSINVPTAAVITGGAKAPGDIIVPRERIIAIGARLLDRLNLDGASILLGSPPPNTSYGLATADGSIIDAPTSAIATRDVKVLVLRLDAVAARDVSPDTGIVTHNLTFDRLDPGGYRTPRDLTLSIVPDRCDIEAGDWFDPQGVGVHRLDKAVRADTAIDACSAALQADPANARFRYQLARGLEAGSQAGEAERLYREAAEAGHTRSWLGYGNTLEARGDVRGADAAYTRGSEQGDPRATAKLGALRLKTARTEAEREAAYELLTEGIDLGLWTSMEAVSDYLTQSGNNRRAGRFDTESERRRSRVDIATVVTQSNSPKQQDRFRDSDGSSDSDNR